ncbi:MAG: right-handed parallel beta-helix repeat-containing protein [Deltaproteobacteria bacterium]|nr:right-handed parallel beta-helix repeat-containing protein [Deltaproteobacteria bacterium]
MNKLRLIFFTGIAIFMIFALALTEQEHRTSIFGPWPMLLESIAGAQVTNNVVSVKAFGAKGDGVSDDTRAIQAAIDSAQEGTTIRFPSGTYLVANFRVKNRKGLSFLGDGRNSVIQQKVGAERIATFERSADIVIQKLAFDANGKDSYGGVGFYEVRQVRVEDCWFWDSAPKPVGRADRYSMFFARGGTPSRDIRIVNNVIEDLQLEVDHSQNVLIDRNIVRRAVNTAGIGIFTIASGAIAEDFQITNNTVVDALGAGFSVGLDPPSNRDCIFRRITIANNQLIFSKVAAFGMRLGTGNSSQATSGNIFEDIAIKDNRIRIDPGAPQPKQMILANSSGKAGIDFDRLIVTGNTIENGGPKNRGFAIDLRSIKNSVVADNTLKNVASGISLNGNLRGNKVHNNIVEASETAYRFEGSLGGNKIANNRVVGQARQHWKVSNLQESDSIQR